MGRDSEKRDYPINNRTYNQRRFKEFKKMTANAKKKLLFQEPVIDTSLSLMVNNKHPRYWLQNWSRPSIKIPFRSSSVHFTSCHNSLEALTRFPSTPCILSASFPTHTTFLMHTHEADYMLSSTSSVSLYQMTTTNDVVPSNITPLKFQF
jgi:hypothetical protein